MKRDFGALSAALLYAAFGAAWIILTDAFALRFAEGSVPSMQTWKGLLYVGITTVLVYGLVRYSTRRIREERSRFREMADNVGDLFFSHDVLRNRQLYAGVAFQALWGRPPGEILANPLSYLEGVHPEDRDAVVDALRRQREGEVTEQEYRVVRPDGSTIWVMARAIPIKDSAGQVVRVVGVVRDITDIKVAQQALANSQRQFSTLIDNLPGATYRCLLDPHWTTLFMSEGIHALTGHHASEFQNGSVTYARLIHPVDRERVFRSALKGAQSGQSFELEYRVIHRDGTDKVVWERTRYFPEGSGAGGFLEGFILDVTDRKRAEDERQRLEERVQQSEKLEAIGQLAGGIAHDFNNLLTVILVRTEMALRKLKPGDAMYAGLREIQDAADRSAGLARQLLTYSKRQPMKIRSLALEPFVEAALPMLRRLVGGDIRLACALPQGLWPVAITPTQIDQILVNLCLNARDAMPCGGKLRIEIHNVTIDEEDCRRHPRLRPGQHVVISVADTGTGMDRHTMSRLFEPFFTTKEIGKGTGLGLPIVHGIVSQLRGSIEVDSEPGKGSVFRIFVPRAPSAEAAEDMIS